MYPKHQHFLVIGTIEDADPPAFGKPGGGAPEEIMLQFVGTWLLERGNLTALRIDPGHHMANRSVFSCRIHALEYHQQRVTGGGVLMRLQRTQPLHVRLEEALIVLFRFAERLYTGGPVCQLDGFSGFHTEAFDVDLHILSMLTRWYARLRGLLRAAICRFFLPSGASEGYERVSLAQHHLGFAVLARGTSLILRARVRASGPELGYRCEGGRP
jgi:hypothetical protein